MRTAKVQLIDRFLEGADCGFVSLDHKLGGFLAAEHLLMLGHRKIGCVTGPACLADSEARLAGYKKALKEFHVPYRTELVIRGSYDRESGMKAADLLMEQEVSAIFAFNDMSAYGVYNRLRHMGKSIPGDFSLVGYDDIFFSEILDVPLTTVEQPIYNMGVEAVLQLVGEIDSKSSIKKGIYFQPKLIVRESTARFQ